MGISRSFLLWCSENSWLRANVPNYKFVRRAVKRFMPGEDIPDAIKAAAQVAEAGIPTVFTRLGENIFDLDEAAKVTEHYLSLLNDIAASGLNIEISLKLTQLGLDLSFDDALSNFNKIAAKAAESGNFVWIDMESSAYTEATVNFYEKAKSANANTGICLQAYLLRTEKDLERLSGISPCIRLVKGAYSEPPSAAFKEKTDVDKNYFRLAEKLLGLVKSEGIRAVFGTHDLNLVNNILKLGDDLEVERDKREFHMLYGIKTNEQHRLAKEGYKIRVLISYGSSWYPWYVRRLAERPANVGFVLKNLFSN